MQDAARKLRLRVQVLGLRSKERLLAMKTKASTQEEEGHSRIPGTENAEAQGMHTAGGTGRLSDSVNQTVSRERILANQLSVSMTLVWHPLVPLGCDAFWHIHPCHVHPCALGRGE